MLAEYLQWALGHLRVIDGCCPWSQRSQELGNWGVDPAVAEGILHLLCDHYSMRGVALFFIIFQELPH